MFGIALVLTACSSGGGGGSPDPTVTVTASGSVAPGGSETPTSTAPAKPKIPVHVKLLNSDGANVGVGMPIIAFFSKKIANASAFAEATKVTADDQPVTGAWYFETSSYYKGYPIEAHYRPKTYWPAHASIHMDLPVKGLSAGRGMAFDNSLTLDFTTDAANISTVNAATHQMTVTSDGKVHGTYPVSLGAPDTPTARGIKVIMEKGEDISMSGPGYYTPHVKYTQRLTYGGEYLHSAPWNTGNIGRTDTSNGCTNLLPADAKKLYDFLRVGDVVLYPNASGPKMQLGAGYGDWNVPWGQWQTGGLVPTSTSN